MRKLAWKIVKLGLVWIILSPAQVFAQNVAYTVDPSHSYVSWHINHFGFSNYSGKWFTQGNLSIDENKPENSQVSVTINIADVVTGNKELDDHLNSPKFFDTPQFPTATFKSNKVIVTGKSTAKIEGILNLHGVSKPVTLDVTLNKHGTNPITDKDTMGFSGHTQLRRSDFGMNSLIPGLSDEVKLDIEMEAFKSS